MTVGAKICGLKTDAAMDAALDGGARYVGLVFFAKSPRNVDIATAARLAARARGRAKVVALVVDADDEELGEIIDAVQPDMLQLHGRETPARAAEIARLFKLPLIKAIAVGTCDDTVHALDYVTAAQLILFDAKPPKGPDALPGGNGLVFDWNMIAEVSDRVPYMLSGGLTAENVADAIRQTGCKLVDVSSGVESAPGIKDPEMIRRFLQAVKTAKQH